MPVSTSLAHNLQTYRQYVFPNLFWNWSILHRFRISEILISKYLYVLSSLIKRSIWSSVSIYLNYIVYMQQALHYKPIKIKDTVSQWKAFLTGRCQSLFCYSERPWERGWIISPICRTKSPINHYLTQEPIKILNNPYKEFKTSKSQPLNIFFKCKRMLELIFNWGVACIL